jgi:hypothetical protein
MSPLCDFIPDELTRPPAASPPSKLAYTETPSEPPGPTLFSRILLWWRNRDKNSRALAALDDEETENLSELGRKQRLEERRARKTRGCRTP